MKNQKFRRRISAELSDKILELEMKEVYGITDDPREITQEEAKKFVENDPWRQSRKGNSLEQMMFGLNETMSRMEDSIINAGVLYKEAQKLLPLASYRELLRKTGRSEQFADLYIQAYEEDA